MDVRSVLAIVLALVFLVIAVVFGAIVALAYRKRRPGFSYFATGATPSTLEWQ
jgi:hypothetical protein